MAILNCVINSCAVWSAWKLSWGWLSATSISNVSPEVVKLIWKGNKSRKRGGNRQLLFPIIVRSEKLELTSVCPFIELDILKNKPGTNSLSKVGLPCHNPWWLPLFIFKNPVSMENLKDKLLSFCFVAVDRHKKELYQNLDISNIQDGFHLHLSFTWGG